MSSEPTQSTPPHPMDSPTASKPLTPSTQSTELEPRLQELAEMVSALRNRRQASLGRWHTPQ